MSDAALLAGLPDLAFGLMLVVCRVGLVVMLLPGLGEFEIPATVRAGLALGISLLVFSRVSPAAPATPDGIEAPRMVLAELLTGAGIGWLARLPALALGMSGGFIATLLGLSSVLQPDPALGGQSTALARLFGLAAPVLLLTSGLFALPLQALARSYEVVGVGQVMQAGETAELFIGVVGATFALAVQISAPFILASVVWQVAVGLLSRIAPQLQAFSAAAPGQLLGGLVLLGLLASRLLGAWQAGVSASWSTLPGT